MGVGLLSQVEGLRSADRHCECEKEVMCEEGRTAGQRAEGRVDGANAAQEGRGKIRPSLLPQSSSKPQSANEHRAVGEIEHFGSST